MPIKIQEAVKILYFKIDGKYEADDYKLVIVREIKQGYEVYQGKLYRQEYFDIKLTFTDYDKGDDEIISSEILSVYDGHSVRGWDDSQTFGSAQACMDNCVQALKEMFGV